MTVALSLLFVTLLLLLVAATAIAPNRARHSAFERKRMRETGADTRIDDARERQLADVTSLQSILTAVLLVLATITAVGLFGWIVGPLLMLVIAAVYGFAARIPNARHFAQKLYNEHESALLNFLQRHRKIFKWVRHSVRTSSHTGFESREELAHTIAADRHVLTQDDKKLLAGSLAFETKTVGDIMTQKQAMFTIKKAEILGPLVLDDLYKTGHDSFPVIDGEAEDVVGILKLRDVQTLDTSRGHTAKVETAMDPDVRFVTADQPLSAALELLLDAQHHMLIVTDDEQSVVGVITLADIIRTLFGR